MVVEARSLGARSIGRSARLLAQADRVPHRHEEPMRPNTAAGLQRTGTTGESERELLHTAGEPAMARAAAGTAGTVSHGREDG